MKEKMQKKIDADKSSIENNTVENIKMIKTIDVKIRNDIMLSAFDNMCLWTLEL